MCSRQSMAWSVASTRSWRGSNSASTDAISATASARPAHT
jgi:hypothetical protein